MNNTNDDEANHFLTLLELGARIDAAHLKQLEESLSVSLRSGRQMGTQQGWSDTSDRDWQWSWDTIEQILTRTGALMNAMVGDLSSLEPDHLQRATTAWEAIQCEGDLLHEALGSIRTQVDGLNAMSRERWNSLAQTLESELEAVHACAQALRIKLELQKRHSRENADRLVQNFVSVRQKRNPTNGLDDPLYDHELRSAVLELQREQHRFLGGMDIVKGLLMWVETSDSRMRKNRSLSVSH